LSSPERLSDDLSNKSVYSGSAPAGGQKLITELYDVSLRYRFQEQQFAIAETFYEQADGLGLLDIAVFRNARLLGERLRRRPN
jgi:hypothetical protein